MFGLRRGPEVLDVLEKQDLRLVGAELFDQPDNVQEKGAALVLEAQLVAGHRERLAGESCR